MALITADQLADELHIDKTDEELTTLHTLITDTVSLLTNAIGSGLSADDVLAVAPQFNRLVSSVATSLYYDRAFSDGYSHGQMILLQQITGIVDIKGVQHV